MIKNILESIPNKSISVRSTIRLDAQEGVESGANNKSLCSIVALRISVTCRAFLSFRNMVNISNKGT